jgi:hypothetical protein
MRRYFTAIRNWLKDKWKVISVTLIISLVGGVPGVINIISWVNDKPKFVFYLESAANGGFTHDDQTNFGTVANEYTFIRIEGAIYNAGNEPLFPVDFRVRVNLDDTSLVLQPVPAMDFDSALLNKRTKNYTISFIKHNDLLEVEKVNPHDAVYGVLLCVLHKTSLDLKCIRSYDIECVDIMDKHRLYHVGDLRTKSMPYFSTKTTTTYDTAPH